MLCSYFYLKSASAKPLLPLVAKHNAQNTFILDSGAFSFMNGKTVTKKVMDQYVDDYIEFINANKINQFVEADIDALFGYEQALKYRKKIEAKTGKQTIPVWHKNRGIQAFKDMCEEYNYVALGGFAIKEIKPNQYGDAKKLVDYAKKKGVKVHGLGYTRSDLTDWNFYSVDSSSWTGGVRYGQAVKFEHNKIRTIKKKPGQGRAKGNEIAESNLKQWIKYQKYMDRK